MKFKIDVDIPEDVITKIGNDLRNYSIETLQERTKMLTLIMAFKQQYPDAVFSKLFEKETEDDRMFMEFIGVWEKKGK